MIETANQESYAVRWLRSIGKTEISEFGAKVADFVDWWQYGIYHLDGPCKRADWTNPYHIEIVVYGGLSTFDGNELTRLVVGAHDRCIRVELNGAAPRYLRIYFHPRKHNGYVYDRHPSLENHVAAIRGAKQ